MALCLKISAGNFGYEMTFYGADKNSLKSLTDDLKSEDGVIDITALSWVEDEYDLENAELPENVKLEPLMQTEFFSGHTGSSDFKVTVETENGKSVAENIEIKTILCKKSEISGYEGYLFVYRVRADAYYEASLPEDTDKKNLDCDGFYAIGPNLDSRLGNNETGLGDWFKFAQVPYKIYYIPKDKMHKLLADNAEELGLNNDLNKDFSFDPSKHFLNISQERVEELLNDYLIDLDFLDDAGGCGGGSAYNEKMELTDEF